MPDKYKSYKELSENTKPREDYAIVVNERLSPISIIAIHGGGIEPGTTELAEALAKKGAYKYYSFIGMRDEGGEGPGNTELHITSNKYVEETGTRMIADSIGTISLHGSKQEEEIIFIGGKNFTHGNLIKDELRYRGFNVAADCPGRYSGLSPFNVCNRNMRSMGVQIEMSRGLRKTFFTDGWLFAKDREQKTPRFYEYVEALWVATQKYLNIA